MISAADAYKRCEQITWSEARNFAYGIRLLPRPKRNAMAALYAMARRIDDVGDGDLPVDAKLAALGELHTVIASLEVGELTDRNDPVLAAVAHAAASYPIPLAALHEIVEGCEQDARGETYATMADTERYCRLVAGSVGRLSLGVFGTREPRRGHGVRSPAEMADDLGVALQLTNMLRDLAEDLRMGRIYLPAADLRRFRIAPGEWRPADHVAALVQYVGAQAMDWFDRGLVLLDFLDHRSRACTAAMAGIYLRLLVRIMADPAGALNERVSLTTSEKAIVAARSVAGLRP